MNQKDQGRALKASAIMGLAVMALPLYLYPMATIDPLDAYPYYTGDDFLRIYLPYALIFLVCSIAILLKRPLAVWVLLASFVASHCHFASYFASSLSFKPLFTAVFIVFPAAVFLLGAVSTLKK